ncbi:protein of unknown function [Streptococcus thermophilus]|nr:protein of unknown function [Streptococcus thermophilus]
MYSQDLSNCTTYLGQVARETWFLYSQDLSNCTTMLDDSVTAEEVFVLSRFK